MHVIICLNGSDLGEIGATEKVVPKRVFEWVTRGSRHSFAKGCIGSRNFERRDDANLIIAVLKLKDGGVIMTLGMGKMENEIFGREERVGQGQHKLCANARAVGKI